MLKKAIITGLVLLISFTIFSQNKKVKCPDGEVVLVPKKPQKAYEAYTKKTDINLKGTITVLDKISAKDLEAGTKREVTLLREKLDQYSSRTEDIIKASFLAYSMTPCDKDVRKKHFELLESINKENTALEKFKLEANKILQAGNAAGIDDAQLKSVLTEYKNNNAESVFQKN